LAHARPLPQDEGPRDQIAEALAVTREEGGQPRGGATRDEEIDEGEGGADGGVGEPHRRALTGHHPQPEDGLADGSSPPPRLHGDGVPEQQQEHEQVHEGGGDAVVAPAGGTHDHSGREQEADDGGELDGPVDEQGEETRADAGHLELEGHRLRSDDSAGLHPYTPACLDIDRFLATNRPAWDRLTELTRRSSAGVTRLSAAEIDELVSLYQRVSAHLSYARTYYRDPALVAQLTGLVARAGAVVDGTGPRTLRTLGRFVAVTFPAALWHIRRFVLVSTALSLAVGFAVSLWICRTPHALL